MMAVAAENSGSGQQRQRRTTTAADNNGMQDWTANYKGKDKSGRQETAETRSGNDSCVGRRWQWWMLVAANDDDSNGG
jgi:hypothetical protein